MKNLLSGENFRKFSSMFLILSLLVQVGVFLPLRAGAITLEQTIFEDGFESNPPLNKWTQADNKWQKGSDAGDFYARVEGPTGGVNNDKILRKSISTSNYENVYLEFEYKMPHQEGANNPNGFESGDYVKVDWFDGTNWNTLHEFEDGQETNIWTKKVFGPLSNLANDNPNFQIRFKAKLDHGNDQLFIDNVKITGTKIAKVADQKISPILECVVDNDDGTYTAHFGYENKNEMEVVIPVGNDNKITGGGLVGMDQGQTTSFLYSVPNHPDGRPGRTPFDDSAFQVDFDGSNLVWSLKGPDGNNRTATASSGSKACPEVVERLICDPNINLIENGSFEAPVLSDNSWNIFQTVPGWSFDWMNSTEVTPSLELHRGVFSWLANHGSQYAELDGDWYGPSNQGSGASTKIWQDIETIENQNYELKFSFSARPNTLSNNNVLGVLWGNNNVLGSPFTLTNNTNQTNWQEYSVDLVGNGEIMRLQFEDRGLEDSMGTFLDNVSLTCQNEPADPCTYGTQVFYSDENHSVGEGTSVETYTHQNWVSTTSDAIWMWSDAQVQNPTQDEVKVFTKTFNVAGVPTDALLSLASDNSYKVIINGSEIASTTNENNFSSFVDYDVTSALVYGENTIEITVHNWALEGGTYETNPAGVIYALYVDTKLCPGDNPHEPEKLQVKVYKYLDGKIAEGEYSFPMNYSWSYLGKNESGQINLNNPYSYTSETLNAPAIFNLEEVTGGNSNVLPIGAQCQNGKFRLVGYRVGSTLTEAEESDLITTHPSLTNLNSNTYIIVENETCPNVSTVTMCKYDESKNPLSGWTLMLLGDLEDSVSVYPDGNNYNSIALEQGNYVLLANGTYVYRPSDPTASTSDAAYSLRLPSDAVYGGPYVPWVRVNDFPLSVQGWLGIQVNESYTDWGSIFNPNHVYAHSTSTSGVLSLRILDDNYGDNSGNLSVDIYEGFAGVTGQNGCVVFENVPYGTYEADEIMKDGWSYLSGRGTVVIDSEDEAISIFNTTDLPELVCKEGESFVEGQCVKDNNDEEDDVQIQQTLTDDTGGTTPPGGRRRDISGLFSSQGSVLGASTDDEGLMCEPYLKEYIKFGAKNNPDEVRKLQIFLNQFFELDNPVTGFYGPITFEMVKKFQAHQEAGTLIPWAVAGVPTDGPTGYVYKTTKRWINILKCPEMLATTPIPQLP